MKNKLFLTATSTLFLLFGFVLAAAGAPQPTATGAGATGVVGCSGLGFSTGGVSGDVAGGACVVLSAGGGTSGFSTKNKFHRKKTRNDSAMAISMRACSIVFPNPPLGIFGDTVSLAVAKRAGSCNGSVKKSKAAGVTESLASERCSTK